MMFADYVLVGVNPVGVNERLMTWRAVLGGKVLRISRIKTEAIAYGFRGSY